MASDLGVVYIGDYNMVCICEMTEKLRFDNDSVLMLMEKDSYDCTYILVLVVSLSSELFRSLYSIRYQ